MDLNNPVIRLCLAGSQAEFKKRPADAGSLYRLAWETAGDDYEACIAAHYLARCQETPEDALHWNQKALDLADAVADERVREFYPSLYLCLGYSYEKTGRPEEAQKYYALAAGLGYPHQAG